MPLEKRDPKSRARLFVPTQSERTLVESQRQLSKTLQEAEELKKELEEVLKRAKK